MILNVFLHFSHFCLSEFVHHAYYTLLTVFNPSNQSFISLNIPQISQLTHINTFEKTKNK